MHVGGENFCDRQPTMCPRGITLPATPVAVSLTGELTLDPTESTTAFPAGISKFYDKSAAATAFYHTDPVRCETHWAM
jgi:hypothetical protein